MERLARYATRAPVAAGAVRERPDGRIEIDTPPDPKTGSTVKVLDRLDFVHALCQQIPDKGRHEVRYYGAYANAKRRSPASGVRGPGRERAIRRRAGRRDVGCAPFVEGARGFACTQRLRRGRPPFVVGADAPEGVRGRAVDLPSVPAGDGHRGVDHGPRGRGPDPEAPARAGTRLALRVPGPAPGVAMPSGGCPSTEGARCASSREAHAAAVRSNPQTAPDSGRSREGRGSRRCRLRGPRGRSSPADPGPTTHFPAVIPSPRAVEFPIPRAPDRARPEGRRGARADPARLPGRGAGRGRERQGARLVTVLPGSPAARAGLQPRARWSFGWTPRPSPIPATFTTGLLLRSPGEPSCSDLAARLGASCVWCSPTGRRAMRGILAPPTLGLVGMDLTPGARDASSTRRGDAAASSSGRSRRRDPGAPRPISAAATSSWRAEASRSATSASCWPP